MNTKMYVITHKRTKIPELPSYVPLLVGAEHNGLGGEFACCDNKGENISAKNKHYCELTGVYWAWKNSDADIIGIAHYRRFFTKHIFSKDSSFFLQVGEIEKLLETYRVIMPAHKWLDKSIIRSINYAPNLADMRELYDALCVYAPDYLEDYLWYLKQNKTHLFNMCVMKREDFNAYCHWLFPILAYLEAHHDMEKEVDNYRKRLYGFLSERLIGVWLHHNVRDDEIKLMRVINTEESAMSTIRHRLGNPVRNARYYLSRRKSDVQKQEAHLLEVVTGERA